MSEAVEQGTDAETVCAVIVTYERRELLAECVTAVLAQSRPPDEVLVVDNASTDGSGAMLAERFPDVSVLPLARNEGGAGGFHEGIRLAHSQGHTNMWLMDDDTIPEPDALRALLEGRAHAPDAGLVTSKVIWTDGSLHPMNRPFISWLGTEEMISAAEAGSGLVPIRAATFVSMLLHRSTVDRHGLPQKRYFIWSDDIEYTARVLRSDPGFIATRSVAVHKTRDAHTAVTTGGERFYFHVRNSIYMFKGGAWGPRERVNLVYYYLCSIRDFLRQERFRPRAFLIVARGVRDAFSPPDDPAGPYLRR